MFLRPVRVLYRAVIVVTIMANYMRLACTICLDQTHAVCAYVIVACRKPVKWFYVKPLPNANHFKRSVQAIIAAKLSVSMIS